MGRHLGDIAWTGGVAEVVDHDGGAAENPTEPAGLNRHIVNGVPPNSIASGRWRPGVERSHVGVGRGVEVVVLAQAAEVGGLSAEHSDDNSFDIGHQLRVSGRHDNDGRADDGHDVVGVRHGCRRPSAGEHDHVLIQLSRPYDRVARMGPHEVNDARLTTRPPHPGAAIGGLRWRTIVELEVLRRDVRTGVADCGGGQRLARVTAVVSHNLFLSG